MTSRDFNERREKNLVNHQTTMELSRWSHTDDLIIFEIDAAFQFWSRLVSHSAAARDNLNVGKEEELLSLSLLT